MGAGVATGLSESRKFFSRPRAKELPIPRSSIPTMRILLNQSQSVLGLLSSCTIGGADRIRSSRGRDKGGLEATGVFFAKTSTPHSNKIKYAEQLQITFIALPLLYQVLRILDTPLVLVLAWI